MQNKYLSAQHRACRRAADCLSWGCQCGMTLIEVLVALAIISIALAALLGVLGHQANTTAQLDRRLLAGWSAENLTGGAVAWAATTPEPRSSGT